jgi:response regulator RpfG family c-di-GMP phosphodiesterase
VTEPARPAILCVDDEPAIRDALSWLLRREFQITTAESGDEALHVLQDGGPFAVVMTDLHMPGMDGLELLQRVRQLAPEATRMLLTGQADVVTAAAAVNHGNVFRFLVKPCPPTELIEAVRASVEQHQLVTAERVLLERTLLGSLKALTEMLAISNPTAFGRATRIKKHATELAQFLSLADQWQIDAAAMLSQVGCITLPEELVEKLYRGGLLTFAEQGMVDRLPNVVRQLFGGIPRLEPVVQMLVYQARSYDGAGPPHDGVKGEALPLGARILRLAADFDVLETQGLSTSQAIAALRDRAGTYDPRLLTAFATLRGVSSGDLTVREIFSRQVQPGMVIAQDVRSVKGVLLIARGHEVSSSLAERLRNLPSQAKVQEPVLVVVPDPPRDTPLEEAA